MEGTISSSKIGDGGDQGDGAPNDSADRAPAESIERGANASRYVDNPDKPDESSVAQLEVLPDESTPQGAES